MKLLKYLSELIRDKLSQRKSRYSFNENEFYQSVNQEEETENKNTLTKDAQADSKIEHKVESEDSNDSELLEHPKEKFEIIFVDDNQLFISTLFEQIQKSNKEVKFLSHAYTPIDLYDLSKEINEVTEQSLKTIIFINIDLKIGTKSRQSQSGVEVLLWLRCKWKIKNPVILYSFQHLGQLLRNKPEHLVINSEGCYFFQLPYDFSKLFNKLLPGISNLNGIRKYIKPAFSIENFRHREANWFGVYKLFLIHNQINIEAKEEQIKPELIFPPDLMNKVNSLETAIHQFLYLQPSSQKNEELNKDLIEKILDKKQELRKFNNPRILYLDDMAHLGWGKLLQLMIYGVQNKNFLIFNLLAYKNIEEIKKGVFDCIESFRPKCLLLDLRLLDEKGKAYNASELSGYQVLKFVKSTLPSLPVIMFSATNKVHTFKELLQIGCDFLWTKEGIDDMYDNHLSLRNYLQLLEYLYKSITKFKDKTDESIFIAQIKLEEMKNRDLPELEPEFLQKNYVVFTDTNIWLHNKEVDKMQTALYALMKNYKKMNLKFIVIDRVINEIIRIGKEKLGLPYKDGYKIQPVEERDKARKLARFVEPLLQNYHDENFFYKDIDSTERDNNSFETYSNSSYADNDFVKSIPRLIMNKRNVLFITEDNGLINSINESLNKIRGAKGELSIWNSKKIIDYISIN